MASVGVAPSEGVPWAVPTAFAHVTNFVSDPKTRTSHAFKLRRHVRQQRWTCSSACSALRLLLPRTHAAPPVRVHTQVPELRSRNRRGSILRSMSKHIEVRNLLVGLNGAGKSTLVEQLAQKDGEHIYISTSP